jgi:hypothetical protein
MGVLARFGHDEDGDEGLLVTNHKGDLWKSYGDTHCFDEKNNENRERMITAGVVSLMEVESASPFPLTRSGSLLEIQKTISKTNRKLKQKLMHKVTGKATLGNEFQALLLIPIPLPAGDNAETTNFAPLFIIDHAQGITKYRTVMPVNEEGARLPLSEMTYSEVHPECFNTLLALATSTPRTREKLLVLVGTVLGSLENTDVGTVVYGIVDGIDLTKKTFVELKDYVRGKLEAAMASVERKVREVEMLGEVASVMAKAALRKLKQDLIDFSNAVEEAAVVALENAVETFELAKKKAAEAMIAAREELAKTSSAVQLAAQNSYAEAVEKMNVVADAALDAAPEKIKNGEYIRVAQSYWAKWLQPLFE